MNTINDTAEGYVRCEKHERRKDWPCWVNKFGGDIVDGDIGMMAALNV